MDTPNHSGAGALTEAQRRHLYDGFAHLDRQMAGIEAILEAAAERRGLFPRYDNDIGPAEREQLESGLARVRAAVARAMAAHGMKPERAAVGAMQAVRSHLNLAELATEEFGARAMRGYGTLAGAQAEALDRLALELRGAVAGVMATETGEAEAATPEDGIHTLLEALEAATATALEAMAGALAEAVEAGRGSDELVLIAGDAMARVARETCAARVGRGRRLPAFEIDSIRWRLDTPRLASLGREYVLGRFRRQLEPRREEVRAALRAYGLRVAQGRN